jgi:transcription antitermination factor NusG
MLMMKVRSKAAIRLGSKVTIKAGPLKGITGVVHGAAHLGRFVVHIDFITAGARVEIEVANLRMNSTD